MSRRNQKKNSRYQFDRISKEKHSIPLTEFQKQQQQKTKTKKHIPLIEFQKKNSM